MQFAFLYILTNASRTYLYVGAAENLTEALQEHRQTACSAFSKDMQPVHLIYFEAFRNPALARSRADEILTWKERQKWQLIMRANPCLSELLWLDSESTAA
ncbi:GIY-YIG nuclease family protein [Flavobacterium selenitireducens]|uniref:GIY-YIG nuclease family protein n=1 Tax=Flavobacterium selenitireducens TaxID=2722704 RepID=UPI00168A6806|nr:GIY-YIG nuclease family protein [Flavobacterium selenitireducens]MBD3583098.1 GIY-YIG nuclease family protein [Flavobacterium selenitireducens]